MPDYPYYKLATWDTRALTFRDGKHGYPTETTAREAARKPGIYRISKVMKINRTDGEPFTVEGNPVVESKPKFTKGGLRNRPGPWTRGPQ